MNSSTVFPATLAIDGGTPVRAGAFSPWPFFDDELCAASDRVLRSGKVNYWTGNEGKLFEQEYAAAIGSQHAIALTNGTVALELALYGLGVGAGAALLLDHPADGRRRGSGRGCLRCHRLVRPGHPRGRARNGP